MRLKDENMREGLLLARRHWQVDPYWILIWSGAYTLQRKNHHGSYIDQTQTPKERESGFALIGKLWDCRTNFIQTDNHLKR
ncbi:hypothetical protein EUGRSUZ_F01523 [Eucalyptus grandis]|uniref:Uncharacterized protein n=2 Tax=Eucalyptus grandis TaxID=71139 RepID=A0ACC3KER0_EUCGR|nr:hypothetical protein EUGRSUZ_F01523 [Eucalyptus grandis]